MGDVCTEFLNELQTFLDNECGPELKVKIEAHMIDCPPCGDRADFESKLRGMIASACKDAAPPGLADDVMARLKLRQ